MNLNPDGNVKRRKLIVVASLDVEEEGLFSGRYPGQGASVGNAALLPRLAPLWSEFRLPLTLFCSHAIFTSKSARDSVAWMRDNCGSEVAAHLHHWCTPPYAPEIPGPPERTDKLPRGLLLERLRSLLQAGEDFQGSPLTSFRMGRWDLKASLLPTLADCGIIVDSSVCPLRAVKGGPDHFLAPTDPWWIDLGNGSRILEAPITQIPVSGALARLWRGMAGEKLDAFHFFGALSANPFWHGAAVMRLATLLHASRGGRVLSLFWHSSEMFPGASPHVPDASAASRMLKKIFSFCGWLARNFEIEGMTASGLASLPFPQGKLEAGRDW